MRRNLYDEEHAQFREVVRRWVEREVVPFHEEWERAGVVPRALFRSAGAQALLGLSVPTEYGGAGIEDFRFNVVMQEEFQRAGVNSSTLGIILQNETCLPYFLRLSSKEQKQRWLPGIVSGELITAVAMTEPGTGSDLASIATRGVRSDEGWIINGSKTFITNGIISDLVITVVRTDLKERHRGISLFVVETGMVGFERGRKLEKIGLHAQDTAELFFNGVEVPEDNLLGEEGQGFRYLMENLSQERLSIAATSVAASRAALTWTLAYVKQREAFGQAIGRFQNSKFVLAELVTAIEVAEAFFDRCVEAFNAGLLKPDEAAMAKFWCSELQVRVVDRCLQLFGGYGYMREYPIGRAYMDARVTTIYGGTSEIMKEVIARSLGL